MKSLTESIYGSINEGKDYIVWFPTNFDLKTIEKDLKELGTNVKIDSNAADDPEGNRARVNTTPKKIEKFAGEHHISWAPLVESMNEGLGDIKIDATEQSLFSQALYLYFDFIDQHPDKVGDGLYDKAYLQKVYDKISFGNLEKNAKKFLSKYK